MLGGLLSRLLGPGKAAKFNLGGLRKIVCQAAELRNMITTSTQLYRFEYPFRPNDDAEKRILCRGHDENFHFVDVRAGQRVPKTAKIFWDCDGEGGESLCIIFPVLQLLKKDGSVRVLEKASVLVKFHQPIDRKGDAEHNVVAPEAADETVSKGSLALSQSVAMPQ